MSATLWLPKHSEKHEKDKKTWMKYCLEKFITNCDKGLLQIATGTLLQIATNFITNCDRYYKLRQPLLQIATGITNCGVITDCDSTFVTTNNPSPPPPTPQSQVDVSRGTNRLVWLP